MISLGTNALASSIVLVCRPRPASAPLATRKDFVTALHAELPSSLRRLQQGYIAPVDLAQAAIGPGIPASIDRAVRLGPVPGPGSPEARFRGRANILIFPDPASGHIACGFAREFGRVRVLGPIYLGAEGAVAGLSESADADDIVAAAALAALGRTGL